MMIPVNEVVQGLLPSGQLVRLMMTGEAQPGSHRRTPGSSILQQLWYKGERIASFCSFKPVFRIRIRIHMFLSLPDPDPLARGMDPDPDPSIIKQILDFLSLKMMHSKYTFKK